MEGIRMKNLKKLREETGLSQQKLAQQLGLTQQSIHSYENNLYEPDIATLKQLSEFFNTSVDYLIGNTDVRNKIEKTDRYELSAEEAEIIDKYRSLSKKNRKTLHIVLDSLI